MNSFKRLITPANKPQGFGFAEFQDPDGALRAMALLNGVELPALEDGCVNKKLLVRGHSSRIYSGANYNSQVKADEKTKLFLDAYQTQKMKTDVSNAKPVSLDSNIPIFSGGRRSHTEGQNRS